MKKNKKTARKPLKRKRLRIKSYKKFKRDKALKVSCTSNNTSFNKDFSFGRNKSLNSSMIHSFTFGCQSSPNSFIKENSVRISPIRIKQHNDKQNSRKAIKFMKIKRPTKKPKRDSTKFNYMLLSLLGFSLILSCNRRELFYTPYSVFGMISFHILICVLLIYNNNNNYNFHNKYKELAHKNYLQIKEELVASANSEENMFGRFEVDIINKLSHEHNIPISIYVNEIIPLMKKQLETENILTIETFNYHNGNDNVWRVNMS